MVDFAFTEATVLRRITLHLVACNCVFRYKRETLVGALSTITSPFFCELVFEVSGLLPRHDAPYSMFWGIWKDIDEFLVDHFAERGHFRLIVRTGEVRDRETFQKRARRSFPLLAERGCVCFEEDLPNETSQPSWL